LIKGGKVMVFVVVFCATFCRRKGWQALQFPVERAILLYKGNINFYGNYISLKRQEVKDYEEIGNIIVGNCNGAFYGTLVNDSGSIGIHCRRHRSCVARDR
jgi:hypothetical protein